jgi:signal peptidase I
VTPPAEGSGAASKNESKRQVSNGAEASAHPSTLRAVWDQIGTLVLAVVIALGVRSCVVEPFRIPSGSMLPTLLIGDHLFVNRFVYGIKVPFTDYRFPGLREPQRGDVVVFTVARDPMRGEGPGSVYPADLRPDLPTESFVKRIVGMPGDLIEVHDGVVSVNGKLVEQQPTGESFLDPHGLSFQVRRERIDGHEHLTLHDPRDSGRDGLWRVESGRYLMMGDNRDQSFDSRYWGTVREAEFKGPAFVIYWSWDATGSWLSMLNPLTWWDLLLHRMRWNRIGSSVS